MTLADLDNYEQEKLLQPEGEHDVFTVERYRQFRRHAPEAARVILDVGCSTGRGGSELVRALPSVDLWGSMWSRAVSTPSLMSTCAGEDCLLTYR